MFLFETGRAAKEDEEEPCPVTARDVKLALLTCIAAMGLVFILSVISRWGTFCKRVSNAAFEAVDSDNSGKIDLKEMEIAIADLYLEVNKYVRVKRLNRDEIRRYMEAVDSDGSRELDKQEFKVMMQAVIKDLSVRVAIMVGIALSSPYISDAILVQAQALATLLGNQTFISETIKYVSESGIGISRCSWEALKEGIPIFKRGTLVTITSITLIYVVVPWAFATYDKKMLDKIKRSNIPREKAN